MRKRLSTAGHRGDQERQRRDEEDGSRGWAPAGSITTPRAPSIWRVPTLGPTVSKECRLLVLKYVDKTDSGALGIYR